MNKFLLELRSTNCKFDRPTAVIIPNMTKKMPPTIGVGIKVNTAPNLEKSPNIIIINPPYWTTRRLPT